MTALSGVQGQLWDTNDVAKIECCICNQGRPPFGRVTHYAHPGGWWGGAPIEPSESA